MENIVKIVGIVAGLIFAVILCYLVASIIISIIHGFFGYGTRDEIENYHVRKSSSDDKDNQDEETHEYKVTVCSSDGNILKEFVIKTAEVTDEFGENPDILLTDNNNKDHVSYTIGNFAVFVDEI